MDITQLQAELLEVLKARGLSQIEFAEAHSISYSWINKFLNGQADNPRLNSINDLQAAIEKERARV